MRSILLHVEYGPAFADRLQYALDLARHFDGHLTCVQAISMLAAEGSDFGVAGAGITLQALQDAAQEERERVEQRLAREDVPWDWETDYGGGLAALQRRAALCDVVVMGPSGSTGDGWSGAALAGQLALAVRTPIIVVPQGWTTFDPTAPALVAWNGASEAGNAVRQALPLLREAESVFLASVEEARKSGRSDLPDTAGAEYLSRHGVECELVSLERGKSTVAEVLQQAACLRECGLLVMGAYGHARLTELLLGGVTRTMLATPPMPLLLAH